ncbi:MAG TPA: DUF5916 domain-containing protein [Chitinophagaceae bacterium]
MLMRLLPALILILFCTASRAQKTLPAIKTPTAPKIDGDLSDAAWSAAPVATDFIQNYPDNLKPSQVKTQVRILYDDDAVYVGALLFDDPALVRRQLTARDGEDRQDVDFFSVFFDTYHDQQNGFQFLVTSANVQTDAKLGGNVNTGWGDYGDKSWDAVWESKTAIKADGWVVEMRIPYISLRFSRKDVQTWGLQFLRSVRRLNESAFWNPVDQNVNGFVNQFGQYTGIRDLEPPLRLSLSPYLSTGVRFNPEGSKQGTEWLHSGGMDVKYGINESFTLDATLIPDFGQVISDNVINNLSPFEVRFQENRPFFTEGVELFDKAGLFYSRRIGATPAGYGRIENRYGYNPDYDIIKNPSVTKLYNAVKLSGRTKSKLGIGVFNAVTAPMEARVRHVASKQDTLIQTEPLTNYNIIVIDKAFKGRSSVTFTNTNVLRSSSARDANVLALDWALYTKNNKYSLSGNSRYSKIFGHTPYNSSYFMNSDTVRINGLKYLEPYDGFGGRLQMGKVSGKLRYTVAADLKSGKYDVNDLGYLNAPNGVYYEGVVSYNQYEPTDNFINYSYSLTAMYNNLYQPYSFSSFELQAMGFWLFKNFWDTRVIIGGQPTEARDFFELQTKGYSLKRPKFFYVINAGSTDSRKRLFVDYQLGIAKGEGAANNYYQSQVGARYRFSNKFSLDLDLNRQHDTKQMGWAFVREANGAPIAGYRDYRDLTAVLSGNYNFTPRLNMSLRARHYWSKVHYLSFWNVDGVGNHKSRGFIPDQDQNVNIFNIDAFLNWDFKPGSRLVAGWKNWLGSNYLGAVNGFRYERYHHNLTESLTLPHGNEFTLRVIYFLDYNQLRRKR